MTKKPSQQQQINDLQKRAAASDVERRERRAHDQEVQRRLDRADQRREEDLDREHQTREAFLKSTLRGRRDLVESTATTTAETTAGVVIAGAWSWKIVGGTAGVHAFVENIFHKRHNEMVQAQIVKARFDHMQRVTRERLENAQDVSQEPGWIVSTNPRDRHAYTAPFDPSQGHVPVPVIKPNGVGKFVPHPHLRFPSCDTSTQDSPSIFGSDNSAPLKSVASCVNITSVKTVPKKSLLAGLEIEAVLEKATKKSLLPGFEIEGGLEAGVEQETTWDHILHSLLFCEDGTIDVKALALNGLAVPLGFWVGQELEKHFWPKIDAKVAKWWSKIKRRSKK